MSNIDPLAVIQYLQLVRLIQLSATFAPIYDHLMGNMNVLPLVISFDQEVKFIWKQRGISAKIFFLMTRYGGNYMLM
ncbi:hypothetical protein JAAARDRAFT_195310 [Jaapia argillacea MUCL 33604]|uniref:DUF6533 domain-containing protein n=1 Tax=Jaapia argillacea MUCL 33604 TaxID=933084 RepID=A0A067PMS8_9AGAM|nr:hypothetical protein JAAARDRAFT_195310 [Jaapia argillacea MUCL 33604]